MRLTPRRAAISGAVVAAVMVGAAAVAVGSTGTTAGARALLDVPSLAVGPPAGAPLAPGIEPAAWLQTPPLPPQALHGKVALIDFWDASCINCRRTFPFLRRLADTYRPAGLVVVGVHTPEFAFERPAAYVERSARELGVTWPVAVDPDKRVWDAYGNNYWPAQYLIDRQGRLRLAHVGEGDDGLLETAVRSLLDEGGTAGAARVGAVPASEVPGSGGVRQTPERYFGAATSAGTLPAGPVPTGRTVQRDDPEPGTDRVTLRGTVTGEEQDVVLAPGASALLRYTARDVYAVLAPGAGGAAEVEVRLDGRPVPAGRRGPSLRVLPDGTTVADVGDEDLRHLLTAAEGANDPGALTLVARGAPVRLFTLTFGA